MDFAVVKFAGKQYLVSENDQIEITCLHEVGEKLETIEVLLLNVGDSLQIGSPFVPSVTLLAEVVGSGKGEKVRVAKFKAKSRYRRVMGFRSQISKLKIISLGGKTKTESVVKPEKKVAKAKKTS